MEILISVAVIGLLATIAVPSYQDAVSKRSITSGAEQIYAFVNLMQSESVKRNRTITVSYASQEAQGWCIGARSGSVACDCTQTDTSSPAYCAIANNPWILRHEDIPGGNLVQLEDGDGAYTFDPIRGMFLDSEDQFVLRLDSGSGKFRIGMTVNRVGDVQACVPDTSHNIPGFKPCAAEQ